MDIECKLKREGGTHVEIDSEKYHFAPLADGAHVATVENEAHQGRFLSITEAYRLYRGATAIETKTYADGTTATGTAPLPEQSPLADVLLGSNVHPASFEIHGKTYALGDVVALAFAAANCTADAWNALTDDERADKIDEQLDQLQADTNGDGTVDQSEERAALAAEYKAKFGKAPHGRWSAAKIREQLATGE